MDWLNKTHVGDCRALMRSMADDGVKAQCIVTSPPYYGLRDYGVAGAIGLEPTLQEWLSAILEVFDAAWDVLADDGVLWLNLGDSYAGAGGQSPQSGPLFKGRRRQRENICLSSRVESGLKPKDLVGQPWRVAFALQDYGWYLRSDIIWHKPNPMPESVSDRPTKAHEYVFLLAKQPKYYYDASAVAELTSKSTHARMAQNLSAQRGSGRANGGVEPERPMKAGGRGVNPKAVGGWASDGNHSAKDHARAQQGLKDSTKFGRGPDWRSKQDAGAQIKGDRMTGFNERWRNKQNPSFSEAVSGHVLDTRNLRTVWSIPTEPQSEAHFATFPTALVRRCILAGSRPGDIVLDMFMGSGTTARVATSLGRSFIGCELNPAYVAIQDKIGLQGGLLLTETDDGNAYASKDDGGSNIDAFPV